MNADPDMMEKPSDGAIAVSGSDCRVDGTLTDAIPARTDHTTGARHPAG
jgi:hypothetical protein